ncbi:MAG: sigma 54-interacting transcriptional regulator [Candidatus Omnitrophica bacterium]|nr:sigma 54-interacting transcriptional regulator [Candidatus Omnitrophota bacterium]
MDGERFGLDRIVHRSDSMHELISLAEKVAPSRAVVLITGESGTGKELFARGIHLSSRRAEGPFVAVNCAAVPSALLESELFGHEKGAFTGAVSTREGKFESASGGTIFLDEIGDMALQSQAKILRALQEKTIQRIGSNQDIPVDIRVVCATNRNLSDLVAKGDFRQDLFYRLNEVSIRIPPLRERLEDLEPLIELFIGVFNRQYDKKVRTISPAALQVLKRHAWPGNVRELEHVIHHAVLMADGSTVWVEHLPNTTFTDSGFGSSEGGRRGGDGAVEMISLDELEARHLKRVLDHLNWNKTQASRILGISRPTLDRKIDKYRLKRE